MNNQIYVNQTASSGAWSFNTQEFTEASNAYLTQILIKAASADTSFHFYIQDNHIDEHIIYDTRTDAGAATGTLRDPVNIPLIGIYTINVVNSDADEQFTGILTVREIR